MSREQTIRDVAYAIWEAEGKPQGRDAQHWRMAEERVAASADKNAGVKAKAPTQRAAKPAAPAKGKVVAEKPASVAPAKASPQSPAKAAPQSPAKAAAAKAKPAASKR
ncbi:DUF2934 domain-containing protein [Bosea sp. (in: a-proteobacteria)]|uniref:DUF2934 domain-containing protein n=1 Tax=Bosea sp. (in: a-proteobacteria) TaxID=1871050 RepID=UPI0025B95FA4|nr:DUF2934 domain-containing protein [Bosea sp. (in: a-proteobacteria)]